MTLEVNEFKVNFEKKIKPPLPRNIQNHLRIKLVLRQFWFLFLIMYQKCLSVNQVVEYIRFVETASLNLVSERFLPLCFFDIGNFKYAFILPHTTLVGLYLFVGRLYSTIYMKLLHYIREQSVLIFL